jgi:hypothetical protein
VKWGVMFVSGCIDFPCEMSIVFMSIVVHTARPSPSLGPGRGAWVLESPESFGLSTEVMDAVSQRVAKALPIRYCFNVAVDGHLIHESNYYNATQTLYEVDSLGKTMAAQVVGVAVTQGLIDLDKPLADYGVQPRCPTMTMEPRARASCDAVLRPLCTAVAPPFDCRFKSDASPPTPISTQCTDGCLRDAHVQAAVRARGVRTRVGRDCASWIDRDQSCPIACSSPPRIAPQKLRPSGARRHPARAAAGPIATRASPTGHASQRGIC